MNIKNLLITEAEKRHILIKHNLIKESTTDTTPSKPLEVSKIITFKGGYYSEKYADFSTTLEPEMRKVENFLKSGKGKAYLVKVIVTAGESKIPNTDAEKLTNGKPTPVEPGVLSNYRLKTIKDYVTSKLQAYKDKGLLLALPTIITSKPFPLFGSTKWIGQEFCPTNKIPSNDKQGYICLDEKFVPGDNIKNWKSGRDNTYSGIRDQYRNEQKIEVFLKLEEFTEIKKCIDNMTVEVNYTNTEKKHRCSQSVYTIDINGVVLLRNDGKNYASLNNTGDAYDNDTTKQSCMATEPVYGGGKKFVMNHPSCARYNKFIISPEVATKILSSTTDEKNGVPKFNINATCINPLNINSDTWGNGCHEGAGDIIITNGKGEKISHKDLTTPKEKDKKQSLLSVDACGKKL